MLKQQRTVCSKGHPAALLVIGSLVWLVLWEGNWSSDASEMTESERAVIPQQTGPASVFLYSRTGEWKREKEEGAGWITEEPRASVSFFLFILLVCFFFSSSSQKPSPPPPPLPPHAYFFPPSSTHFRFALFQFLAPSPSPPSSSSSSSSLFSSLCLPREKRFCLLLVSAPSQSAFLISSYCFCLIFKCYPGPNGNPYKKKKKARSERRREKPAGYCVSLQDPETKAPPPLRERFGRFLGGGRGEEEEPRLEDGSQVQSKGGDIFSWCLLAPRTTL